MARRNIKIDTTSNLKEIFGSIKIGRKRKKWVCSVLVQSKIRTAPDFIADQVFYLWVICRDILCVSGLRALEVGWSKHAYVSNSIVYCNHADGVHSAKKIHV